MEKVPTDDEDRPLQVGSSLGTAALQGGVGLLVVSVPACPCPGPAFFSCASCPLFKAYPCIPGVQEARIMGATVFAPGPGVS